MATFQELLDQAAGVPSVGSGINQNNTNNAVTNSVPVVDAKKANLSDKSEEKKQALSGQDYYNIAAGQQSGSGIDSASEAERDIRQMSAGELVDKYGADGVSMLLGAAQGNARYGQDVGSQRSTSGAIADTITDASLGLANSIGGIGALGAGLINREAGADASAALNQLNEFAQGTQTPALQSRRQAYAARQASAQRDSELQRKRDVVTDGETIADLKKVGRDVLDSFGNTLDDGMLTGSVVSSGLGSLLGVGPVAGVLRGGARVAASALSAATKAELAMARVIAREGTLAGSSVARTGGALNRVSDVAIPSAAMGLMEAGGSYQQTVNEVMSRTHSDLAENSPQYVEYVSGGMTPEEARIQVATDAANEAAAITAPAAMLAGSLVGRFAENPLGRTGIRTSLRNIGAETVEEATQGATGQTAQNLAMQRNVDPSQSLTEGVGEQIAQGAIGGLGSAGALQVPSVGVTSADYATRGAIKAGKTVFNTVSEAVKPYTSGLIEKGRKLAEQNKKASPVSAESTIAAVDAVNQNAATMAESVVPPTDTATDDDLYVNDLVGRMSTVGTLTPEAFADAPESIRNILATSEGNKAKALNDVAMALYEDTIPASDQLAAATVIRTIIDEFDSINPDDARLANIEGVDDVKQFISEYRGIVSSVSQMPSVQNAMTKMEAAVDSAIDTGTVGTVTPENINTPEGQQAVNNNITVASIAPEKADLNQINTILSHADAGDIVISPKDRASLQSAVAILNAVQKQNDEAAALGLSPSDIVSQQITTDDVGQGREFPSARAHARAIYESVVAGDLESAKDNFEYMRRFAEHMKNKVDALNKGYETGKTVTPKAYFSGTRGGNKWGMSKIAYGVTPNSLKSVQFAQRVNNEATAIADIYNNLVDVFPEAGATRFEPSVLDTRLLRPAADVVAEYKAQSAPVERTVARSAGPAPTTVTEPTPVAEPVQEVVPEPVVETEPVVEAPVEPEPIPETEVVEPTPEPVEIKQAPRLVPSESTLQEELDVLQSRVEEGNSTAADETRIAEIQEELATESEPTTEEVSSVGSSTDSSVDVMYPGLIGDKEINWFKQGFKIPQQPMTHTVGLESPMESLFEVLAGRVSPTEFTGSSLPYNLTTEIATAYQEYFANTGNMLLDTMDQRLQDFLNKKTKKGTNKSRFGTDSAPNHWKNGKATNIVVEQDGEFKYQDTLLQLVVLAGLSWRQNAHNRISQLDSKDVASITNIPEGNISDGDVELLSNSMSMSDAITELGNKIIQYWGLQTDNNVPLGRSEGIARALASEIVESFITNGDLTFTHYKVMDRFSIVPNETEFNGTKTRDVYRLSMNENRSGDPKASAPNLLDDLILNEPEPVNYLNGKTPPVAQNQMRNNLVQNTQQQKELIAKNQNTDYYIDQDMLDLYGSIGIDNMVRMFGKYVDPNKIYNKNHELKLDGQERAIRSAYQYLFDLDSEMRALGSDTPVPVRYAFNISRVQRLQMIGRHTPQSNKTVREVVLPTGSTLDTNNPQHRMAFHVAIGQAFGQKIETVTHEVTYNKVVDALDKMADAQEIISDWLDSKDVFTQDEIDRIKQSFKDADADFTELSLHALVDFVKYSRLEEGNTSFQTNLYIEHDGKTNGLINAMMVMNSEGFNPSLVKNLGKGGIYFNAPEGTTLNGHQEKDSEDIYKTISTLLNNYSRDLRATNPQAAEQFQHLDNLLALFLNGAEFKGEGANRLLDLARNVVKNPATITTYGSGAAGIAGNITKEIVEEIYATLTDAANHKVANPDASNAETFFGRTSPTPEIAQERWNSFTTSLNALTQTKASLDFGKIKIESNATGSNPFSYQEFTFTKDELDNLRSNIQYLLVRPMRMATNEVVGMGVMNTLDTLRKVTQVQSIFMKAAYEKGLADLSESIMDEQGKKRPMHEGFSRNELNQIHNNLKHLYPTINTPTQSYLILGSRKGATSRDDIASTFDDRYATGLDVYRPDDAGVSGIAFLNIGFGDGQSIQNIDTQPNPPERTLPIFDGINSPLDNFNVDGTKMNKGVFDAWSGNPARAVLNSYSKFMASVDLDNLTDDQITLLTQAITGNPEELMNPSAIKEALQWFQVDLENKANSIDAYHNVVNSVRVTVDQMAGAMTPHINAGTVSLTGSTNEDISNELNELYRKELNRLQAKNKTPDPREEFATSQYDKTIRSVGRKSKSGAQVLGMTALRNLSKTIEMSPDQRVIFDEIVRNLTSQGYEVVYGTPEELTSHIGEGNEDVLAKINDPRVKGITVPNSNKIYLKGGTVETLVHELIHANTFDTVLDYYSGGTGSNSRRNAIKNLETLMDQFLTLEDQMNDPLVSPDVRTAYRNASAVIQANMNKTDAEGKAVALNEFMAWSLANPGLSNLLGRNRAVDSIIKFMKQVFDTVKQLIWGNRQPPVVPGKDMLSNVQFNTAVLINSPPSVLDRVSTNVSLNHAVYGTSDRLVVIQEAFNKKIAQHLKSEEIAPGFYKNSREVDQGMYLAVDAANMVSTLGFNMSMQELSTFKKIVATLATEAEIDKNALAKAQELYTHTVKNLSVDDFLTDPQNATAADRYYAQQKYDVIVGTARTGRDNLNRTTLLPVFLGLATVNDEFRAILAGKPVPRSYLQPGNTLDAVLENIGTRAVDSLSNRLSGIGQASDIKNAVDNLTAHIVEIAQDQDKFVDQFIDPAGNLVDRANEYVIQGMEKLSDMGRELGNRIETRARNRTEQLLGRSISLASTVITEDGAAQVAEGVMSSMNKTRAWQPFYDLVNDLVGRTASNSAIYDMIKTVRAMIQQDRQNYRTEVPKIIASKFSRELTDAEWSTLHTGLGKTDIASLLSTMNTVEVQELLSNPARLNAMIRTLEQNLKTADSRYFPKVQTKAKQLAQYMYTGEFSSNLLRNAFAVANLFGETGVTNRVPVTESYINDLDKLITLYSLQNLNQDEKDTLASLAQNESEGMGFTMSYLVGQRVEEQRKLDQSPMAKANHYKGYIPTINQTGVSLIVADDSNYADLISKSYVRVADYKTSSVDKNAPKKGYYFAPVSGNVMFNQGIMQNVRHTASGVDTTTGLTDGLGLMSAGSISDSIVARRMQRLIQSGLERGTDIEYLLPVYNDQGEIQAYERTVSPVQRQRLNPSNHMGQMIGVWRGRQVEEAKGQYFNDALVDTLYNRYREDLRNSADAGREYINILDPKQTDPVVRDAARLLTTATKDYIETKFGPDTFMVRKDMLNDSAGYRSATVGDVWTGNSRWSKETQDKVRHLAMGIFGNKAYQKLVNSEKVVQNFVQDAKYLVVVKSVIVPMVNMMSTTLQLVTRGVPIAHIVRGMPKKAVEIDSYLKGRLRFIDLEAELLAAQGNNDVRAERKIRTEMQTIQDGYTRLSIWPLIEAGEFSSISDADINKDDALLTEGKLNQYMETLVDKLPPMLQTAGRYALVTKDTAMFQGLQKAIQYGDFLGKAVLYDDLTKRQKKSKEYALGRITEEFVNYDRLPGRFRGYIESMGLLWFYNYKIRIAKVAASIVRNNPVQALIGSMVPVPSGVGLPMSDNVFSKALGGTLPYSVGIGQGLSAPFLNPWLNMAY